MSTLEQMFAPVNVSHVYSIADLQPDIVCALRFLKGERYIQNSKTSVKRCRSETVLFSSKPTVIFSY